MRSADTTHEAHARQIAVYRAMSPARRVAVAVAMSEEVSDIAAAGIRSRHPDYDGKHVAWALHRLRLGDELFREAWPDAPFVAP